MTVAIINVLKDLGFEEREIKIYLALIGNSDQTALQISKQTEIDRTTTYDLLEKMIQKGIAFSKTINNSKHFNVLNANQLLVHFQEKYSSLEKIVPKLNNLSEKGSEKINCELFQGLNGLKTVLRDLINSREDYCVIGIKKKYEETLNYFNDHGIIKLNEFKVREKAIVGKNEKFKKLSKGAYRSLDKPLSSDITTLLYGDVVIFFIWKEPYFAIRINSKEFTKGQKEYFNLMWNLVKK